MTESDGGRERTGGIWRFISNKPKSSLVNLSTFSGIPAAPHSGCRIDFEMTVVSGQILTKEPSCDLTRS